MNNIIKISVLRGLVATAIMTVVMFIAPMMGLPKMNPPEMLSMVMGVPLSIGWMMHFMIGIIFAISYGLIFKKLLSKINSNIVKGLIFGMAAFVWAQISMQMMGLIFTLPPMQDNMALMMIGSIFGHLVFGVAVTTIFKNSNQLATL